MNTLSIISQEKVLALEASLSVVVREFEEERKRMAQDYQQKLDLARLESRAESVINNDLTKLMHYLLEYMHTCTCTSNVYRVHV